ncbi:MAG: LysM peptidoglycan-binding domain-containing protein [Oscillospiraceae bacterium]|jgi:LysM repeat protein|nr:LysM peptidoglycan-binding domain-containing protein [Oscillospiraceae bacterium]
MTEGYMGYRDFLWPRLPDKLKMEKQKYAAVLPQPENGETMQELGRQGNQISGSGSFLGTEAPAQWRKLCRCFEQSGAGMLYLPGRLPMEAFFTELTLEGTPRPDRICYHFTFREKLETESSSAGTYQTGAQDNLWSVAAAVGVAPEELLAANPGRIHWAEELPEEMELKLP